MEQAVVLVGHGSKLAGSNEAIECVVKALEKKEPSTFFLVAFLELQSPNIPEAIRQSIEHGAREVIVIPYFVQTGRHVVQDIPKIVLEAQTAYPGVKVRLGEYLGFDERIVSVVFEKVRKAREQ